MKRKQGVRVVFCRGAVVRNGREQICNKRLTVPPKATHVKYCPDCREQARRNSWNKYARRMRRLLLTYQSYFTRYPTRKIIIEICSHCKHDKIAFDPATNEKICEKCGHIQA